jgi:hypothetical protein
MVGYLLARGAKYTISVAAVGDQERIEQLLHEDSGLARRLDSARESPLFEIVSYRFVPGDSPSVPFPFDSGPSR